MPQAAAYIRTGIKRVWRNFVTARFRPRNGWAPPPSLVTLRPTDDCTLRCKMCCERGKEITSASWRREAPEGFLSGDEYVALVDELAAYCPSFYITGGEPLMSEHLETILSAIKRHGLYVSINTNGTLLKDRAELLVSSGVDRVILSLDGPPEIHDTIRGRSFETIAEGVRELAAVREAEGKRKPAIRGQCVISPYNVKHLAETVPVAAELGLSEIRFQHLMFAFTEESYSVDDFLRTVARSVDMSNLVLSADEMNTAELVWQVQKIRAEGNPAIRVAFEPPIRDKDLGGYYRNQRYPFADLCLGPWRRLVVSSRGELGPCQGLFLGRYPDITPAAIWWGHEFRALRRHMVEQGLFQYCTRCCHREYYGAKAGIGIS